MPRSVPSPPTHCANISSMWMCRPHPPPFPGSSMPSCSVPVAVLVPTRPSPLSKSVFPKLYSTSAFPKACPNSDSVVSHPESDIPSVLQRCSEAHAPLLCDTIPLSAEYVGPERFVGCCVLLSQG